jgi:hypothetical protein
VEWLKLVEFLPSKFEALSSNPSITKKKIMKAKKGRGMAQVLECLPGKQGPEIKPLYCQEKLHMV